MTQGSPPPEVLFYEQGASWIWVLAGPASAISMEFVELSAGYGFQLLVPGIFLVLVTGFLAIQIKAARIHTSVELTPDHLRQGTERIRIDDIVRIYPEPKGPDGAEVAVGPRARGADGGTAPAHRHRPQVEQRSRRPGVGAQTPATAGRADPPGGRAHTPDGVIGAGVMRAMVELLLAVVAAVGCVLSWLGAGSTVVVAPVLDGEPKTTSVVYSPPLLVLSLLLATVAGVLAVVAIARLRRGQRTPK